MNNKKLKENIGIIYKVTNDINNKVYIGQTTYTLEQRWANHVNASLKNVDKFHFHSAIRKYGPKHFKIEEIERCPESELNNKEKYYIQKFNSIENGYNISIGGEGTRINQKEKEEIFNLWESGLLIGDIAKATKHKRQNITNILRQYGVTEEMTSQRATNISKKSVYMIDKDTNEILKKFDSLSEAEQYCGRSSTSSNIRTVCKGKQITSYGYKWCYTNDYENFKSRNLKDNRFNGDKIEMIDKDTKEVLNTFISIEAAVKYLKNNNISSTANDVTLGTSFCNPEKISYGYLWRKIS